MTVDMESSEGFSAREEAVCSGRGTCDGDNDWVYNISNWLVLSSGLRRDRCSALMTSECSDMGEHLHENHRLPEGQLLAESTQPCPVRAGCVARIVWADSETGESTTVGVQILKGRDRHRLYWCGELEYGERVYAPKDPKWPIIRDTEAEFLTQRGRYAHSRATSDDLSRELSAFLEESLAADSGNRIGRQPEARELLAKAAYSLARRHIFYGDYDTQPLDEEASMLMDISMRGEIRTVGDKIMEAVEHTDLLSDEPRPFTSQYAIAKKAWQAYDFWKQPLKKFKTCEDTSNGN